MSKEYVPVRSARSGLVFDRARLESVLPLWGVNRPGLTSNGLVISCALLENAFWCLGVKTGFISDAWAWLASVLQCVGVRLDAVVRKCVVGE